MAVLQMLLVSESVSEKTSLLQSPPSGRLFAASLSAYKVPLNTRWSKKGSKIL